MLFRSMELVRSFTCSDTVRANMALFKCDLLAMVKAKIDVSSSVTLCGLGQDRWWFVGLSCFHIQTNQVLDYTTTQISHGTKIFLAHRYTVLPETQKYGRPSTDRHISMLWFYENMWIRNYLCGHNILTEIVFVTKLSGNAGISVWRIVWVTTILWVALEGCTIISVDTRWCSLLRHCATSRKVAGSISDGVTGNFYWFNPSGRTMALGW